MSVNILHGDCRAILPTRQPNGQFVKGQHSYRQPQPHWDRDWLVREYETNKRSTGDIARSIGCTDGNVIFWLRKHGIARRRVAEARALKKWGAAGAANPMFGKTGDKNPRYVDGSSPERQRLYAQGGGRQFIIDALARDGFKCRRCGVGKSGAKSLHVHHIKSWAGNEALRFDMSNVVTLCRDCHGWVHSRANVAREWLA